MSHAGHRIEKCECGIVLAQCRCAMPDKPVVVVSPCVHKRADEQAELPSHPERRLTS